MTAQPRSCSLPVSRRRWQSFTLTLKTESATGHSPIIHDEHRERSNTVATAHASTRSYGNLRGRLDTWPELAVATEQATNNVFVAL